MSVSRLRRFATIVILGFAGTTGAGNCYAKDYFLTVGGGYIPQQNQASLEANVLFFQRILADKHPGNYRHDLFFADGFDSKADLQVLASRPSESQPLTELLSKLHRRGGSSMAVEYRNHNVRDIGGASSPANVHSAISNIAKSAVSGDRLLVYVTAHGGPGKRGDARNTTISCWNGEEITVADFSEWLGEISPDVPVILVMAQCYCGGFADTIFQDIRLRESLTPQLRIGFFAQQSDLPAAGCRPDIEHDQEFSSYFWGAMAGQSRNGEPMVGADADQDGIISFDEAFAHSVIIGETIDIPLKSSYVLLRQFSRIPDYTLVQNRSRRSPFGRSSNRTNANEDSQVSAEKLTIGESTSLAKMAGPIQDLISETSPATRRIIVELGRQFDISDSDDIEKVLEVYEKQRTERFSSTTRGRASSGRRELLSAIGNKWPELADRDAFLNSELLSEQSRDDIFNEISQMEEYKTFIQRDIDRSKAADAREDNELREVAIRRLVDTIESVVLAKNLPSVASEEIVARYQEMVRLEQTALRTDVQ